MVARPPASWTRALLFRRAAAASCSGWAVAASRHAPPADGRASGRWPRPLPHCLACLMQCCGALHLAAARRLRAGNLQMRAPRLRMRGPANSEGHASGRGGAQRGRQAAKAQPGPSWVAQQRTGVERRRWPPRDALMFTSTLLAAAPSDVLEPGG